MNLTEHEQMHVFTSFPETAQDDDTNQLLDKQQQQDQQQGPQKTYSFWQIEFYQQYFNVGTNDVLQRILGSMIPRLNNNYLLNQIRPNPDLYGPFWVSITLIFTIAITGNIVNFFQNFGKAYTWQTDFHKVTTSAAAILFYWWCVPTILYFLARWRQHNKAEISFLEMLCIYGYSLSIFIPISILWVIQINLLQWIVVLIALLLSGGVLVLTFFPIFSNDKINIYLPIMIMIFILHGLLAIGFMLYFFHVPKSSNININQVQLSSIPGLNSTLTKTS